MQLTYAITGGQRTGPKWGTVGLFWRNRAFAKEHFASAVVSDHMKGTLASAIAFIPLISGCLQQTQDELALLELQCTVLRSDRQTGFVTDRFEFNDVGLVRHDGRSSPDSYAVRVNRYEGSRVASATVHEFNKGGEVEPYVSWQKPMATYTSDVARRIELQFEHDDAGRLVSWASQIETESTDEVLRIEQLKRITYDDVGRKGRSDESAWASNRPDHTHRTVRTYNYREDDQLHQITNEKVDAPTYAVNFFYDDVGRFVGSRSGEGNVVLPYRYDELGRLVGIGSGGSYTWNGDDQIVERNVGSRVHYVYARGRLHDATFEDGSGYIQDYSAGCPTGFSHPLITPHTLYHTHYEGPPLHYTWSAF